MISNLQFINKNWDKSTHDFYLRPVASGLLGASS